MTRRSLDGDRISFATRGARRAGLAPFLKLLASVVFVCLLGSIAPTANAQQDYKTALGIQPFTTALPVENGYVDASNGSLNLSIPLGTYSQRGSLPFTISLVYSSNIWAPVSGAWQGTNLTASDLAGWRLVMSSSIANDGPGQYQQTYASCSGGTSATQSNFYWIGPDGAVHYFPITTEYSFGCGTAITSGDAFAADSSGYHMFVWDYVYSKVYAPDGTLAYCYGCTGTTSLEDTNGNYFTSYGNTDTLGRVPVTRTANCDPTYSGTVCYDVLNSQGTTSRFEVVVENIDADTNFGQAGITECSSSCEMSAMQTLLLPDGMSYSFTYDSGTTSGHYGLLTSMTMPTGATINYSYSNFTDAYGNVNRLISGRTTPDGTYSYTPAVISTCTSTQVGCQQKFTAVKPSGDTTVYTFTLNNGAWPVEMDSYTGSSTLLATQTSTWDFTHNCVYTSCIGSAYITKLSDTTTLPVPGGSNINRTTKYTYDTTSNDGNVTQVQEWKFYTGSLPGTPDRTTTTSYLTGSGYSAVNVVNRPASVTVYADSSSGTKMSQTNYAYDCYGTYTFSSSSCSGSSGPTGISGIVEHDDTNFGTSYTTRGNLTQVQKWIGSSSYLTSSMTYDTTGQVTSVTDPAGNTTSMSYSDNFYNDASTSTTYSPSTATNAYLTQVTQPTVGSNNFVTNFSYYYGSGQLAKSSDVNSQITWMHYLDSYSRPTETLQPGNLAWSMANYTSTTQTDLYTGVASTTPSTSCSSDCIHNEMIMDTLGRASTGHVMNDPDGETTATTTYDGNGRTQSVATPYFTSGGSLTASDTTYYDGMDRPTSVSHLDGTASYAFYGAAVGGAGGASQQCSTCGIGYPVMSVDEAGKVRESWLDGFGNLIEVDEPNGTTSTAGSGSSTTSGSEQYHAATSPTAGSTTVTIYGSEQTDTVYGPVCGMWDCSGDCMGWIYQWTTYYDQGDVAITVNGHMDSTTYGQYDTASTVTSNLAAAINADSGASVTASASGSNLTLTAKTTGASTNYSLSGTSATSDTTGYFSSPSFYYATYTGLSGGANATSATYDSGTAWVSLNGVTSTVSYGTSSTAGGIASALASGLTSALSSSGPPIVTISVSGDVITVNATTVGGFTDYSLSSGSTTNYPSFFSSPSFAVSVSGSAMTGGSEGISSPNATSYTYDVLGNLLTVTEGSQTRTYTYDGLSRMTSAKIPETTPTGGSPQTSSSNYDSDSYCSSPNSFPGQLVSTVDARGVRTCMQYDALNRVTQVNYNVSGTGVAATSTVTYHYDYGGSSAYALGRLTSMDDALGSGSESYTYDPLGRVKQLQKIVDSQTYTTSYNYNAASEPTQVTYPSSRVVQSGYDAIGQLCGVGVSVSGCTVTTPYLTISTSNGYDALGHLLTATYGNGVAATFSYSANRMQLTSLAYVKSSTTLFSLSYGYTTGQNNNGQITNITDNVDNGRSVAYTYDPLSRLSSATTTGSTGYPAWGLSWTYDRYGNRLSQASTAGSPPTTSDTYANPGGAQTNHPDGYTYDANGNMLGDGYNTLTYDAGNHVISASNGTTSGGYVYDGNGLRVEKCIPNCSSPTSTTVYIFSNSKVIAEYALGASASSPSEEYLYAGTQLVATVDSSTRYHHSDHLSVRLTTDSSGTVLGQQGHYPFGESWYSASTTTKWEFTSYERDSESGNDYAMARYNVNRLGRFSSVDPMDGDPGNPQSLNRYIYVVNNPINLTDPFGLFWNPPPLPPDPNGPGSGDPGSPCWEGGIDCGPQPGCNTEASFLSGLPCDDDPGDGGGGAPGGSPGKGTPVVKNFNENVPCSADAAGTISAIKSKFSSFGNYTGTFVTPFGIGLAAVRFGNTPVASGNSISIKQKSAVVLPNPILTVEPGPTVNTSVTVASTSPTSFTFDTVPGHVLYPASITFSAANSGNGNINFSINVNGQTANIADTILYEFGGDSLENNIWNNFLANVAKFCMTN